MRCFHWLCKASKSLGGYLTIPQDFNSQKKYEPNSHELFLWIQADIQSDIHHREEYQPLVEMALKTSHLDQDQVPLFLAGYLYKQEELNKHSLLLRARRLFWKK